MDVLNDAAVGVANATTLALVCQLIRKRVVGIKHDETFVHEMKIEGGPLHEKLTTYLHSFPAETQKSARELSACLLEIKNTVESQKGSRLHFSTIFSHTPRFEGSTAAMQLALAEALEEFQRQSLVSARECLHMLGNSSPPTPELVGLQNDSDLLSKLIDIQDEYYITPKPSDSVLTRGVEVATNSVEWAGQKLRGARDSLAIMLGRFKGRKGAGAPSATKFETRTSIDPTPSIPSDITGGDLIKFYEEIIEGPGYWSELDIFEFVWDALHAHCDLYFANPSTVVIRPEVDGIKQSLALMDFLSDTSTPSLMQFTYTWKPCVDGTRKRKWDVQVQFPLFRTIMTYNSHPQDQQLSRQCEQSFGK
jgi:hypothetical protein